jgi:hypothetical protein
MIMFRNLSFLAIILSVYACSPKVMTVPEVHNFYHHDTDSVFINDSVIDRQTTIIREVDSATMAKFGIQMERQQRAWLVQNEKLMKEISMLKQSKNDTVHIKDSIPVPYPVEKKVTAKERLGYLTNDLIVILCLGGVVLLIFNRK